MEPITFSPRAVLTHPQFRLLFGATFMANVARWMEQFAIGWLVIELAIRDGRPELASLYVGLTGLARLLPTLAFGLIGGISADRADRRMILVRTRTISMVVSAIVAALTLAGRIDVVSVLVLSAIAASAFGFDGPATFSLGPSLIPRHTFSVVSFTRTSGQVTTLVGPLLGGLLIGPLGSGGVLVVVTALFAVSRLILGGLQPAPPSVVQSVSAVAAMREAVAYILGVPILRALTSVTLLFGALTNSLSQLLPAVAHDTFRVGAEELSWLASALAVGSLAGALVTVTMVAWPWLPRILWGAGSALGISIVLFGMQREYAPALVLTVLIGCTNMIYNGGMGGIVQVAVHERFRGRVIGLQTTMYWTGTQLGTLILGAMGSIIGVSNAIAAAGVVTLVAVTTLSRIPAVRTAQLTRPSIEEAV